MQRNNVLNAILGMLNGHLIVPLVKSHLGNVSQGHKIYLTSE